MHPDEEFLSILYELHIEFKLKRLMDLKKILCGALTNNVVSNAKVLKFVENLSPKSVETLKLKITILT